MKFLAFAMIISSQAFAVQVKHCPAKISVEVSDFQVTKSAAAVTVEDDEELNGEQGLAIQAAVKNASATKSIKKSFSLKLAKEGRCHYYSEPFEHSQEIDLYTRNGKNTLMVSAAMGPRGILLRTYIPVTSVKDGKITLEKKAAGIALALPRYPYEDYEAGGALVFIGKANKVTVK